ncbi:uncharacterized protein LOC127749555 [Frankliniella occidentalis]|uniref:Uncharacterized protein LOC127749555 n=1 Tax=Frankliniella occidentalis TaxID=133901 RepID=A0A9C6TXE7_FRAOC|nr:uncharacterized protein LOC127749555 [Frankliniella occidentalis]
MELVELPDDVLMEVMSYLDVKSVLACRLVCKRIAALALHPDVWRRQRFNGVPCACAILRLAPCLARWPVHLSRTRQSCSWMQTMTTTTCAVADLSLALDKSAMSAESIHHATLIIRNQAALGRLKRLALFVSYIDRDIDCELLSEVTSARLQELRVHVFTTVHTMTPHPDLTGGEVTPSLKTFRHMLNSAASESFCRYVLGSHAATLEVVDIGGDNLPELSLFNPASITSLLCGMPNLRTLACPPLPGLEAVAACKSLREVFLWLGPEELCPWSMTLAAAFLRRATQLCSVTLRYANGNLSPEAADLVRALRPCVESLDIECGGYGLQLPRLDDFAPLKSLVSALPSLPALRLLTLRGYRGWPDDQLLLSMNAAPALRCLVFDMKEKLWLEEEGCFHAWLHRSAVNAAFSANPLLHIRILMDGDLCRGIDCPSETCKECSLGCLLQELNSGGEEHRVLLSSHPADEYCSEDHSKWAYIRMPR